MFLSSVLYVIKWKMLKNIKQIEWNEFQNISMKISSPIYHEQEDNEAVDFSLAERL